MADVPASLHENLERLERAAAEFRASVEGHPQHVYLTRIAHWTPRDVAARLVGWNRLTVAGCEQIRRGERPGYFDDAEADYRT